MNAAPTTMSPMTQAASSRIVTIAIPPITKQPRSSRSGTNTPFSQLSASQSPLGVTLDQSACMDVSNFLASACGSPACSCGRISERTTEPPISRTITPSEAATGM